MRGGHLYALVLRKSGYGGETLRRKELEISKNILTGTGQKAMLKEAEGQRGTKQKEKTILGGKRGYVSGKKFKHRSLF